MARILVIDDDPLLGELAQFKLASAGHHVDVETDGRSGLESVAKALPELIILDMMLPVISGAEVLNLLKSDVRFSQIPVIVLSLRSGQDDVVNALQQGACDYVVKPFVPDELVARVERHLLSNMAPAQRKRPALALGAVLAALSPTQGNAQTPSYETAIAQHEDGDHRAAVRTLESLKLIEATNADVHFRLGVEKIHADDLTGAEKALADAIELAPSYADAIELLAKVRKWRADLNLQARLAEVRMSENLEPASEVLSSVEPRFNRQWSVAVVGNHSWFHNAAQADWREVTIVAGYRPDKRANYLVQLDQAKKFGRHDVTMGAQAEWRVGSHNWVSIRATGTPNSDFREKVGFGMRLTRQFEGRVEVSIDARAARYATGTVFAATPKASLGIAKDKLRATVGWINIWDETKRYRSGWTLRGDFNQNGRVAIFGGAARYPETEAGNTRRTRAVFLGSSISISEKLRLGVSYERERREGTATRKGLSLSLRWIIDDR